MTKNEWTREERGRILGCLIMAEHESRIKSKDARLAHIGFDKSADEYQAIVVKMISQGWGL